MSHDEIGKLTESFNAMETKLKESRAKLEEYSKTLEKQVADRTKELESKVDQLEKFNKIAVDRELKMIKLKKEIGELKNELTKNQEDKKPT
jgi:nitrate/nitrite-specific signal transduction histidine kinase